MPNCEIKRGQLCTLTGALGPTSSSVTILNMTMMTQFQYQSEEYIILSNISNKNQYQLKYIKRYNISFYLNLSQEVICLLSYLYGKLTKITIYPAFLKCKYTFLRRLVFLL